MKKSSTLTLALLCVVLAGISLKLWLKLRETETLLTASTSDRTALQTRVADLEKRAQTLQSEIPARPRSASASGPNGTNPNPRNGPGPGGPMQALESPEMRRLMAIEQKGRLDGRYAALFKSLKLPPEQLDKLKQLLVDKQSAPMDVFAEARAQGLVGPESRGQIQALLQTTNQEIDDSIRATLGDAAYSQYQQYDRSQSQRNVVDQLTSRLSYTDAPLTAQQAEQLVAVLSANTSATTSDGTTANFRFAMGGPGGGPAEITMGGGGTPLTNEAIASVQGLLSSSQLDALRQLQAEQQAQQQMGQALRQSLGPPGTTTTITSGPSGSTAVRSDRPPNN